MHRLKSVFISTYLTYTFVLTVLSVIRFVNSLDIVWIIAAVIHALPIGFIIKLYLIATPRTSRRLTPITVGIFGLTIFTMLVMQGSPDQYPGLFAFIIITFLGWLLYVRWYTILPVKRDYLLKVGTLFPDLQFEINKGEIISTSKFHGSKTIYLFFRGNWCPLCMAQIKELANEYKQLKAVGAQVVLISPQPHGHTKHLAKKYNVPFIFLTDPKNTSAKKLHLEHKKGVPMGLEVFGYESDTVLPTVVITDEKGVIIFADQTDNYRVRPEPAMFFEVLKANSI